MPGKGMGTPFTFSQVTYISIARLATKILFPTLQIDIPIIQQMMLYELSSKTLIHY